MSLLTIVQLRFDNSFILNFMYVYFFTLNRNDYVLVHYQNKYDIIAKEEGLV